MPSCISFGGSGCKFYLRGPGGGGGNGKSAIQKLLQQLPELTAVESESDHRKEPAEELHELMRPEERETLVMDMLGLYRLRRDLRVSRVCFLAERGPCSWKLLQRAEPWSAI